MHAQPLSTWRALFVSLSLLGAGTAQAEAPNAASPPSAAPSPPPQDAPPPNAAPASSAPAPVERVPATPKAPAEPPAKSLYAKGGGFSVRQLSAKELKKLKRTHGLYVDHIVKGTPAEAAGLKVGDILMSIDGKSTKAVEDAVGPVTSGEEGQTFHFVVLRGTKDITVDVRLPGESREEREAREKKEREEREEKEREEREDRERREEIERREREAREKAEQEAKEKLEQEAKEKAEEEAKEDTDRFGLCGCCIASMACPAGAPFFAVAALLVENESPPPEPDSESEVTVVAY